MKKLVNYLWARLLEKSTWAGFVLAIGGGIAFPHPWDYVAIAFGMIGVIVPEKGTDNG